MNIFIKKNHNNMGGILMDINIREHIINNFNGDNYETLKKAIDEAVKEQDEVNLPGLGVFLEIIWENSSQKMKNEMINIIKQRVEKGLINKD
jgi:small acid-soluble spore protein I (minor)